MNENYFEIPVHSCSQECFFERVKNNAEKVMAGIPNNGNGFWEEQLEDEINRHLYSVSYNEIIGSINVYAMGSQLRADYWYTNKKSIVIGSKVKGTIEPRGKLIECHYKASNLLSVEIYEDFRRKLEKSVNEHFILKKRFVDYSTFDRCGPFIDWRKILNL